MQQAKIAQVEANGTLALADGRTMRLEGILLAAGARDHAPAQFAARAIQRLTTLANGQRVTIAVPPPDKDRYGRIRAQVVVKDSHRGAWLQELILEAGLARVAIASDRRECAQELFAAEERARAARAGIWSSPAYRVRANTPLASDVDSFQIVQGTIAAVTKKGGGVFLEFASRPDFAAVISANDMKDFHRIGVDPFAYEGSFVRVRGWVDRSRGRMKIDIGTPDAIEVVESTPRK